MGSPLHAFDWDTIRGGIVVRRARKGERVKTLDGVERVLDERDLVIADHERAVALVTNESERRFLERRLAEVRLLAG